MNSWFSVTDLYRFLFIKSSVVIFFMAMEAGVKQKYLVFAFFWLCLLNMFSFTSIFINGGFCLYNFLHADFL